MKSDYVHDNGAIQSRNEVTRGFLIQAIRHHQVLSKKIMKKDDLAQQIVFIAELEKLKTVFRKNGILDHSRYENSAEHSWHIAVMAIVFAEYSQSTTLNVLKVVKMLLLHDLVEIETGDTFLYDEIPPHVTSDNETKAARRLFGLLPDTQAQELFDLWKEFEERKTAEAKYAAVMDALQPLLNHDLTAQEQSNPFHITTSNILKKKHFIQDVSPLLWDVAKDLIRKGVAKGLYIDDCQEPVTKT